MRREVIPTYVVVFLWPFQRNKGPGATSATYFSLSMLGVLATLQLCTDGGSSAACTRDTWPSSIGMIAPVCLGYKRKVLLVVF